MSQIFSQENCPSREILLTTVYHHKNSRSPSDQPPEFSFLIQTIPSKPDQEQQQFDQAILRLQCLNESILQSMYQLDDHLKEQLTKRGRIQYLKLSDKPFPSVNESVYKQSFGNPSQFSQVQRQASVFEVDQNNNFLKIKDKSISKHMNSLNNSCIIHHHKSNRSIKLNKSNKSNKCNKSKPKQIEVKPVTITNSFQIVKQKRKRVYESVLSQFSTATLLKMNGEEQ